MQIDLAKFKAVYDKWVEENLADFQAGKVEKAVKAYPLIVSEGVPWTPFTGEPSDKTFALITSGGLYLKGSQAPFETGSIHGDPSFREIPKTVRLENVGIAHGHYDPSLAEQDLNTIFPIQRFLELEKEGIVGRVADLHYSFSYVNDVVTLVTQTIPQVMQRVHAAGVDVLFLVPV
ncbi:MAG: hypothetical protein C4530_10810 [Desulfobacteraceae bacterium]|nr:MAG: hypothetical protein C4530_10810 [Desulfobacteraceae bacterium]